MKIRSFIALAPVLFVFSATPTPAQESNPDQLVRPRIVAQQRINPNLPNATPAPAPSAAAPVEVQQTPAKVSADVPKTPVAPVTFLTPSMIQARISEARRLMKTQPKTTAL